MKKIIALLLALCIMSGTVAFADQTGSITVTYTIATSESYILTVPATATLNQNEGGPTGYMKVSLDATGFNVSDKTISVALTEAAYALSNGTDTIAYDLQYNTSMGPNSNNVLDKGDTFITWTYGEPTVVNKYVRIHVSSSALTGLAAGSYSDTLTFTASVS